MSTTPRLNGYANGRGAEPTVLAMPAERTPPWNEQAEMGMLAGLMCPEAPIRDVLAIAKVHDLYRASHQILYRAIIDLFEHGKPVDIITVVDELIRRDQFREIGGDEYLGRLMDHGLTANVVHYAVIVQQNAILRSAIEAAQATVREAYSYQFTGDELIARTTARLEGLAAPTRKGGSVLARDVLPEVMEQIQRRQDGEVVGIETGFTELDGLCDGLQPQELIVLAGRPSMGKSGLAMNICEHVSIKNGRPTLFYSLEMGKRSILTRSLVSQARIDGQKIRTGVRLEYEETRQLQEAYQKIANSPLRFVEEPSSNILRITQEIRAAHAQHGIQLAVVDYLQIINLAEGGRDNLADVLDRIVFQVKSAARDLNIPIILVSQLNRSLESRTDKRPMMSDLRGSGAIEQHADVVMFVYRDSVYNKTASDGVAQVIVGKNRNGPIGTFDLAFLPSYAKFENITYRPDESRTY